MIPQSAEAQRFFRFLAVGILNTIFGYGVFALIYLATSSYRIAIVVATAIGVLFNFATTGRLVFGNRGFRAFFPFVAGYVVVLGLNIALVEILVATSVPALVAQLLAIPVVVPASYAINALAVFRKPR